MHRPRLRRSSQPCCCTAGRRHARAASGFSSLGSDLEFSEPAPSGLLPRSSDARAASLDAPPAQPGDAGPVDASSAAAAKAGQSTGAQQAQSAELIPPELR